jgi:hypothetical protein
MQRSQSQEEQSTTRKQKPAYCAGNLPQKVYNVRLKVYFMAELISKPYQLHSNKTRTKILNHKFRMKAAAGMKFMKWATKNV